ncbi:MAG: citramalate synthase [Planctomycetaceae bacterium]|nr:citramalate synthase [Planctomycetaceae bacterium]MBQ2822523.1 citramalate synthase [Thermoguttaceae bacterium]
MKHIELYDTTLRDGSQAEGISFSLHDKCQLATRLAELGFDFVEGGYPASNDKDRDFFLRMANESKAEVHQKICAFGMTRRKGLKADVDVGLQALLAAQARTITMVGKSSRFQVEDILRCSRQENLDMIHDSIMFLKAAGREVFFDAEHAFDGFKADPEYTLECLRAAEAAGASRIILCDTNGGSMPTEIYEIVRKIVAGLNIPVGIHCHNDCELAVANSLAAVDAGATQVQGCVNGFGERCGNANLISIAANLALKKGYDVLLPGAVKSLTDLSRYVYEMVNLKAPANQPYVGKSAFAHKGGMHVSAVNRNSASYEHIHPAEVGNERRILVSELSGRSNIVAMAEKHHIQNDSLLMERILEDVVARESMGYSYEAASGSFDLLVRKCSGTVRSHFDVEKYHVNMIGRNKGDESRINTEAIVKLRVAGETFYEVADGDGPVNALDSALRKALIPHYPSLKKLQLLDYKVRVINSEAGTAAGVRVIIESKDETSTWGTVGVSENVVEASWIALTDSFEYKLFKDGI